MPEVKKPSEFWVIVRIWIFLAILFSLAIASCVWDNVRIVIRCS